MITLNILYNVRASIFVKKSENFHFRMKFFLKKLAWYKNNVYLCKQI